LQEEKVKSEGTLLLRNKGATLRNLFASDTWFPKTSIDQNTPSDRQFTYVSYSQAAPQPNIYVSDPLPTLSIPTCSHLSLEGVCRVNRGSSPEPVMAASPEHRDDSSSFSSVEVPVKKELEICVDAKQIDSGGDSREAASGDNSRAGVDFALNNGAAEPYSIVHRSFSEVGTSRVGTSNIEKLDSSQPKLVKSKTEAPRHRSILAEDAAQIFDNKMSAQKKVRSFLNATCFRRMIA
ncbi:hypothetical protein Gohar_015595, partial [Gossypium harknessii]|nr:hypothetical protein [Gossypium harknessii]